MINAFEICGVSAFLLLFSLLLRFNFAEFFYGFDILTNIRANARYAYIYIQYFLKPLSTTDDIILRG